MIPAKLKHPTLSPLTQKYLRITQTGQQLNIRYLNKLNQILWIVSGSLISFTAMFLIGYIMAGNKLIPLIYAFLLLVLGIILLIFGVISPLPRLMINFQTETIHQKHQVITFTSLEEIILQFYSLYDENAMMVASMFKNVAIELKSTDLGAEEHFFVMNAGFRYPEIYTDLSHLLQTLLVKFSNFEEIPIREGEIEMNQTTQLKSQIQTDTFLDNISKFK